MESLLIPYVPETPGELWLQSIAEDDIMLGGSGKGNTHYFSGLNGDRFRDFATTQRNNGDGEI